MSIADLIKEHFEAAGRVRIEVPEIKEDGKPLVLYSQPLTVKDRLKLRQIPVKGEAEYEVELVMMKCELEDGSKAFNRDDKPVLMKAADWRVIATIADKITGQGLADLEKKLRSDPERLAVVALADRWGLPQTVIEAMPVEHMNEQIALQNIRKNPSGQPQAAARHRRRG